MADEYTKESGGPPPSSTSGSSSTLWSITLMPEWYLIIGMFAALFTLTLGWGPAVLAGTGLTLAIALPAAQAVMNATRAKLSHFYNGKELFRSRITIFTLHLPQLLARRVGRIGCGLTPWLR